MRISDTVRRSTALWIAFSLISFSGCEKRATAPEDAPVNEVVSDALSAWQQADWKKMYQTLSSADKRSEDLQSFREKRGRLHKAQKLKDFRVNNVVREGDSAYRVDVLLTMEENYNSGFRSGLEPRTSEVTASWTVVKEEGSYKITFVSQEPQQN